MSAGEILLWVILPYVAVATFLVGLWWRYRADQFGWTSGSTQMFEALNRTIAANAIKPVIDKVFGFDDVQAAYKHMASGAHFGKIVIRVA